MRKIREYLFILLTFFVSLSSLLASCSMLDMGMGESVDMDPPTVKITYPERNAFVPGTFSVSGTAYDNRKVDVVEVRCSFKNEDGSVQEITKYATVMGSELAVWSCSFSFTRDTDVSFTVIAYDSNRNTGIYSTDSTTAIVNTKDPDCSKTGILRNGNFIAQLLPLSAFTGPSGKTAQRESTENKDYFQNQSFKLFTSLDDTYGIQSCVMNLFEVDDTGSTIQTILSGFGTDAVRGGVAGSDIFAPEFTVSRSDLPSSFDSGVHYLKPQLLVTNTAGTVITQNLDIIAWEDEYDKPHVVSPLMDGAGAIAIPSGNSLPLVIFDDDGLSSADYKLVTENDYRSALNLAGNDVQAAVDSFSGFVSISIDAGKRDGSHSFNVGNDGGRHRLLMHVTDINSTTGFKAIPVNITNGDAAVLLFKNTTPEENTVPSLTGGAFTLEPYTLDNEAVEKIAVAWIPGGVSLLDSALSSLDGFDFPDSCISSPKVCANNVRIWTLKSQSTGTESGKTKNSFSKTFRVYDSPAGSADFKVNGNLINDNKIFVIYVRDKTENVTYKVYRLNAHKAKPEILIEHSALPSGASWTRVNGNLTQVAAENLYVRAKAVCEGNVDVASVTSSTEAVFVPYNAPVPDEWKYFKIENPPAMNNRTFSVSAVDKLGNSQSRSVMFSFGEKAELAAIEIENADGSTLIKDGKVRLQAVFTSNVTVTLDGANKPYINLTGVTDSDGNPVDARAVFAGNASDATSSVYFEYTVPAGVKCSRIKIDAASSSPIICPGSSGVSGLQKQVPQIGKTVAIDSIPPKIKEKPQVSGLVSREGDRSLSIHLKFDKPVFAEKGYVTVQRTSSWRIPAVIDGSVFDKLTRNASQAQKTALSGGFSTINDEPIKYLGPYKQYTQGIKKEGGKYVPDLSTKYVLEYSRGLDDTAARSALEALGYHKKTYQVPVAFSVTGNDAVLNIKDSDFVDGIKDGCGYEILLDAGAFRDAAGNYTDTGLVSGDYRFIVGGVCKPVIRVDRTSSNGASSRPSGRTTFRVDCETPGVALAWGILEKSKERYTYPDNDGRNNSSINGAVKTTPDDALIDEVEGYPVSSSGTTVIGEDDLYKSMKVYIKAEATKNGKTVAGYEGAYKTIICERAPKYNNGSKTYGDGDNDNYIRAFGSQVAEGASYTPGWPLTQNKDYGNSFMYRNPEEKTEYYFVSWEIQSDYFLQTAWLTGGERHFLKSAVRDVPYGGYTHLLRQMHW